MRASQATNAPIRYIMSLPGHLDYIHSVRLSTEGEHVASVASDHRVCIWNTRSGALLQSYTHTCAIEDVAWSREGKLAWMDCNGGLFVWDGSQESRATCMVEGGASCFSWVGGEVVYGRGESIVAGEKEVRVDGGGIGAIRGFGEDSKVVLGLENGEVVLLDEELEELSRVSIPDGKGVRWLSVGEGRVAAQTSADVALLEEVGGGLVLRRVVVVENPSGRGGVSMHPSKEDGRVLVAAGSGEVLVVGWESGEVLDRVVVNGSEVRGVDWGLGGDWVVVGADEAVALLRPSHSWWVEGWVERIGAVWSGPFGDSMTLWMFAVLALYNVLTDALFLWLLYDESTPQYWRKWQLHEPVHLLSPHCDDGYAFCEDDTMDWSFLQNNKTRPNNHNIIPQDPLDQIKHSHPPNFDDYVDDFPTTGDDQRMRTTHHFDITRSMQLAWQLFVVSIVSLTLMFIANAAIAYAIQAGNYGAMHKNTLYRWFVFFFSFILPDVVMSLFLSHPPEAELLLGSLSSIPTLVQDIPHLVVQLLVFTSLPGHGGEGLYLGADHVGTTFRNQQSAFILFASTGGTVLMFLLRATRIGILRFYLSHVQSLGRGRIQLKPPSSPSTLSSALSTFSASSSSRSKSTAHTSHRDDPSRPILEQELSSTSLEARGVMDGAQGPVLGASGEREGEEGSVEEGRVEDVGLESVLLAKQSVSVSWLRRGAHASCLMYVLRFFSNFAMVASYALGFMSAVSLANASTSNNDGGLSMSLLSTLLAFSFMTRIFLFTFSMCHAKPNLSFLHEGLQHGVVSGLATMLGVLLLEPVLASALSLDRIQTYALLSAASMISILHCSLTPLLLVSPLSATEPGDGEIGFGWASTGIALFGIILGSVELSIAAPIATEEAPTKGCCNLFLYLLNLSPLLPPKRRRNDKKTTQCCGCPIWNCKD